MVYKEILCGLIVQIVPKFVEKCLYLALKNVKQDVGALMGYLESLELIQPAFWRKTAKVKFNIYDL